MPDLLIELLSEEIPARMQAKAAEDLRRLMTDGLVEAGLTYAGAGAHATPRRLCLAIEGLLAESPDTREERKGPKVGAPDTALEGFLRGAGLTKDQLEQRDTPKGPVWFATIETPGRPAAEIIAEVLEKTVRGFPWPKSMRWGSGNLRWVRPLQGIICLLSDEGGAQVVPLDIDGLVAGDTTVGHRFLAPAAVQVTGFDDYAAKLKAARVILSPEERSEAIWADVTQMAFANGLEPVEDKGLLAEVAGLVEWPVVLIGEIGADFLDLPPEVLTSSMKEHQKFFSLGKGGKVTHFATVANTETADNGATILAGNQKVLAARLADAKFFWDNDLRVAKAGMGAWTDALGSVTFHNKLGTVADRVARVAALAREIAPAVGADPDQAETAAKIAKADLSSEMVYEFPDLQGVMGAYYGVEAGHSAEIAAVAREHYQPLGPSDDVPTAPLSVTVALADKIDTLTGFWAIDEKPTGSKDPFALRRAALGVIRLVLENGVRMGLQELISNALVEVLCTPSQFHYLGYLEKGKEDIRQNWITSWTYDPEDQTASENNPPREILHSPDDFKLAIKAGRIAEAVRFTFSKYDDDLNELEEEAIERDDRPVRIPPDLLSFFHDRLKVYFRDQNIRHDVVDAVLGMSGSDDLVLVEKRARALNAFLATEDGENLVQGFKRANNILSQAEEKDGVEYSFGADPKFAETDEEKALFAALDSATAKVAPAMGAEDFPLAMQEMAKLRAPVDAFFEAVQVNADSEILRRNRLNLLSDIRKICAQVADLTRIEG